MSDYPANMTLRPIDVWPHTVTSTRQRSNFSAPWRSTLDLLDREIFHLGNGHRRPDSILQIAMRERDFRIDGMPRANAILSHPGVILNIESRHGALSYPCDKFDRWQDNLRAIALGLEALRKVDRYGITNTGQQYRGWQAIESAPSVDVLGAARTLLARVAYPDDSIERQTAWADQMATSQVVASTVVKRARKHAHPDRNGGDQSRWDEVEQALGVLGLREVRVL